MEKVSPASHELRRAEEPENDEGNEASQNRAFLEAEWAQFFVLLTDDMAHVILSIGSLASEVE